MVNGVTAFACFCLCVIPILLLANVNYPTHDGAGAGLISDCFSLSVCLSVPLNLCCGKFMSMLESMLDWHPITDSQHTEVYPTTHTWL